MSEAIRTSISYEEQQALNPDSGFRITMRMIKRQPVWAQQQILEATNTERQSEGFKRSFMITTVFNTSIFSNSEVVIIIMVISCLTILSQLLHNPLPPWCENHFSPAPSRGLRFPHCSTQSFATIVQLSSPPPRNLEQK